MPKQKTRKSVSKRFKLTGSGKIKRNKAGHSHMLIRRDNDVKRAAKKSTGWDFRISKKCRLRATTSCPSTHTPLSLPTCEPTPQTRLSRSEHARPDAKKQVLQGEHLRFCRM